MSRQHSAMIQCDFKSGEAKKRPAGQRLYSCHHCAYRATAPAILESHIIRRHTEEYPFACSVPECNYKAKIASDLRLHQKNRHRPVHPVSCNYEGCNFKTKFKKDLQRHVFNCHSRSRKRNVDCPLCSLKFFNIFKMREHLMTHTKEKPWSCSLCNYEGKSNGHLRRHFDALHGTAGNSSRKKLLTCNFCDFTTTFTERLKAHVYSHSTEQPFACDFPGCNFRTKRKQQLGTHKISNHAPERHPCLCQGCRFVATHKTQLRHHINAVHKKQFACKFLECYRRFRSEAALVNHQRLHDPNRPFQCEHCRLRFCKKDLLALHTRFMHTEEKHLACSHCEYKTNRRHSLRSHLTRIHQAENIACSVAGCSFKSCSPYEMEYHSRIHDHKSHPFKCEYCPCGFTHSTALTKHLKREHRNVPKQLLRIRASRTQPSHPLKSGLISGGSVLMNEGGFEGHLCQDKVPVVILKRVVVK